MSEFKFPLSISHVNAAKQQAHFFRNLIKSHCNIELTKGQSIDCFSQVYHGENWSSLMANLHPESNDPYYASDNMPVISHAGKSLSQHLIKLGHNPDSRVYRCILDMPMERYKSARTDRGAFIATIINGIDSWDIHGNLDYIKCLTETQRYQFYIYDAKTGDKCTPIAFTSDQMTGQENILVHNHVLGWDIALPLDRIGFIEHNKDSYSECLAGYCDDLASIFPVALNRAHASRWFGAGGGIKVVFDHPDSYVEIQGNDLAGPMDFSIAVGEVMKNYPGKVPLFMATGIEVNSPEERWNRKFTHSHNFLPILKRAESVYNRKLTDLIDSYVSEKAFAKAMEENIYELNLVGKEAITAFWKDTREINSKYSLLDRFKSEDAMKKDVIFRSETLEKYIGLRS